MEKYLQQIALPPHGSALKVQPLVTTASGTSETLARRLEQRTNCLAITLAVALVEYIKKGVGIEAIERGPVSYTHLTLPTKA